MISRAFRAGTFTVEGRYFATGSSSATSPFRTMSARMSDVKTLVIDPISKTVLPSRARPFPD